MNSSTTDPRAAEVLDFWFGRPGDAHHLQTRPEWFRKDEAFDALIAQRFGALIHAGLRGELTHWAQHPLSSLALIVLLDQFTRNTRRATAGMFAGDALALAMAKAMVAAGTDRSLAGVQRQFLYLPFEHSEDLADQRESMRLFTRLGEDEPALGDLVEWARKHEVVIERFGRFPHRNAALGRPSTAEEAEFLEQPGSGF